jgi:uncharacterized protein (TIGR03437 family)
MRALLIGLLTLPGLAADSPAVSVTPLALNFAWQTGQTASTVQAVVLTGAQTGTFTVTRPAPWLLFANGSSSISGTYPTVFPLAVNAAGMSAGVYRSTLLFQTAGGAIPVSVTLQVSPAPVLVADPGMVVFDYSSLEFAASVLIANSSQRFVLLSASTDTPWLAVKATGATVQVTADPAKVAGEIALGSFSVVSTSKLANEPLVVPVVFLRKGFASQGPNVQAVVNAATFLKGPGIAPGEIVTLGGTGLGPASLAGMVLNPDGTVSTSVAGTQVLFNGAPSPIVYTRNDLVSAIVPYELAGSRTASVQVVYNGVGSNVLNEPVVAAAPGIFTANAGGTGPGAILNEDGSANSEENPAAKGSVVMVYATGEGQTNPSGTTGSLTVLAPAAPWTPAPVQPVAAWIGGQPAQVEFAGEAPGLVSGVLQLNVQIPENAASGELPIQISVGGVESQPGVTVFVR